MRKNKAIALLCGVAIIATGAQPAAAEGPPVEVVLIAAHEGERANPTWVVNAESGAKDWISSECSASLLAAGVNVEVVNGWDAIEPIPTGPDLPCDRYVPSTADTPTQPDAVPEPALTPLPQIIPTSHEPVAVFSDTANRTDDRYFVAFADGTRATTDGACRDLLVGKGLAEREATDQDWALSDVQQLPVPCSDLHVRSDNPGAESPVPSTGDAGTALGVVTDAANEAQGRFWVLLGDGRRAEVGRGCTDLLVGRGLSVSYDIDWEMEGVVGTPVPCGELNVAAQPTSTPDCPETYLAVEMSNSGAECIRQVDLDGSEVAAAATAIVSQEGPVATFGGLSIDLTATVMSQDSVLTVVEGAPWVNVNGTTVAHNIDIHLEPADWGGTIDLTFENDGANLGHLVNGRWIDEIGVVSADGTGITYTVTSLSCFATNPFAALRCAFAPVERATYRAQEIAREIAQPVVDGASWVGRRAVRYGGACIADAGASAIAGAAATAKIAKEPRVAVAVGAVVFVADCASGASSQLWDDISSPLVDASSPDPAPVTTSPPVTQAPAPTQPTNPPVTSTPPSAPTSSTTTGSASFWRGSQMIAGSCGANSGCRYVNGTVTGLPANTRFYVRCGSGWVDTSINHPVVYAARYTDSGGVARIGNGICGSSFGHNVTVFTAAGHSVTGWVAAP